MKLIIIYRVIKKQLKRFSKKFFKFNFKQSPRVNQPYKHIFGMYYR